MQLCFASAFTPSLHRAAGARAATRARAPCAPMMALRGFGGGRFAGQVFDVTKATPLRTSMVDEAAELGGGSGGRGSGGGGSGGGGGGGGGAGGGANPLGGIWRAYNDALEAQPILTKAFTSLIGFFLGDLLAQKFLGEPGAALDRGRLARMASFGFLIHGPTGHYFYSALDRIIVGKTPLKVASKVFVDQVLWAPIFTVLFFGYLGLAERKSRQDIVQKVKNDTWTGVTASWKFWPAAHVINFAFVPTQQRLLYINTLQVGYNVILSIIGNKPVPKVEE